MTIRSTAVDIESLGNPENSGYGVVVPNFAFVTIPDFMQSELEYLYVQMPVQEQLDVGLKVGASTLDFWHNECARNFPGAHDEMTKSYSLKETKYFSNYKFAGMMSMHCTNIPHLIRLFTTANDTQTPHVYGNGCHFDCSILQENSRVQFGDADLWPYAAPQNARTLKNLLNTKNREDMDSAVRVALCQFVESLPVEIQDNMQLHHPLYDAAREALQISYCLALKKDY